MAKSGQEPVTAAEKPSSRARGDTGADSDRVRAQDESDEDSAPSHFGPYEVIGRIGAGGMGVVYRARDPRIGRDVAVKVLDPSTADTPGLVRRFEQEARAAGALNHPNLVAVYDVGEQDGQPYLVAELLEGKTLQALIGDGRLSMWTALDYAVQIGRGMAAAHEEGIVHRDLKPANIFVTSRGHVKILDFGIAKLHKAPGAQDETMADNTSEGCILGTTGYMSPEQVRGKPADHRSDIFSFGIILFELITGKRPFVGVSAIETAYSTLRDDPPALLDLAPRAPPALTRIVKRCLEKNPSQRFQTARDLTFHLETITDLSVTGPTRADVNGAHRLPLLLSGAMLIAALVVIGLWLVTRLGSSGDRPGTVGAVESVARGRDRAVPNYDLITFRRGSIRLARFAPDGASVVYSAAWGGEEEEIYLTQVGSPGSRAMGHRGATLFDVSSAGELAIATGELEKYHFATIGTLSRTPLGGGGVREVAERVTAADWSPDGESVAAVLRTGDLANRLEYPLGTVLIESSGWLSHPRISPAGDRIAFIDHADARDDRGAVAVVDLSGTVRTLTRVMASAQGLAWSADGDEIWFTAAESGTTRAIWAVDVAGNLRLVAQTPGTLTLHDVSRTGDVLLTRDDSRMYIHGQLKGDPSVSDLSWFDWSLLVDMSRSGDEIYFLEAGEAARAGYALYSRKGGGAPAVRLTSGVHLPAYASPDGQWILAARDGAPSELILIPTGAGGTRTMTVPDAKIVVQWAWEPDGRHVIVRGLVGGKGNRSDDEDPETTSRLWRVDTEDGSAALLPWGDDLALAGNRAINARGQVLVGDRRTKEAFIVDSDGRRITSLGLVDRKPTYLGWASDETSLLVREEAERALEILQLDLKTRNKRLWRRIELADPAGVSGFESVQVGADGFAFSFMRKLSQLYVVTDLS